MNETGLVSVVMNVHNGEEFISEALASVFGQTYSNLEVVVWNNASTDRTQRILDSIVDPRLVSYSGNELVPLYEARNSAVQKSRGDWICFLDADDWWEKSKVEKQVERLRPGIDAVYSNHFVFNQFTGRASLYSRRRLPEGQLSSALLRRYVVGFLTLMVSRRAYERAKFDPSFQIIGDFDFVTRVSRMSEMACVQEPLAWRRVHLGSESEQKKAIHLAELVRWQSEAQVSGLLSGEELRNLGRMVHAKRAEVNFENHEYLGALLELLRARPLGRQVRVAQRILTTCRSLGV